MIQLSTVSAIFQWLHFQPIYNEFSTIGRAARRPSQQTPPTKGPLARHSNNFPTSFQIQIAKDMQSSMSAGAPSNPQEAPILTLPVELIRHISSLLGSADTASFSLTARWIYYTLGTGHLNDFLGIYAREGAWHQKYRRRLSRCVRSDLIEILERAFPSKWYCERYVPCECMQRRRLKE